MRWYHICGALLFSLLLSLACLMAAQRLVLPLLPERVAAMAPLTPTRTSYSTGKKQIPILLYHAIGEYESLGRELFVSADVFAQQLDYLQQAGFHTIHFSDLWEHWEYGMALPDKPLIISFDDGYRSFYHYALPLLKEREMTATVFVITNHVDLPRTMTPGMIWDALDEGIEIGSHSHNHLNLTTCSPDEVLPQLLESKDFLEELIGIPVQILAYPGGQHNQLVRDASRQAGYRMAVGTVPGINSFSDDYFQLHRIYIQRKDELDGFISIITAFTGE